MKLGNPIRVAAGVSQVRAIGARITVLTAGNEAMLVDAGMRGSYGPIVSGLDALGLSLDSVNTLVISHRHPDHSGGVGELIAGRSIVVMAHTLEAGILAGRERHPSPFHNKLVVKVTEPVLARVNGSPIDIDVELSEGDVIPFPFPVHVVHLPGHTAGSIALFLPDQKLVIIGDALQHKLGRELSPPAASVTDDLEQAVDSLYKLLDLNFDAICFSHFPPMRSGASEALRKMLNQQAT